MSEYVIAVARGKRSTVPSDWKARVQRVDGVRVKDESTARLVIDASQPEIQEVHRIVGAWCRIEPVITHDLLH